MPSHLNFNEILGKRLMLIRTNARLTQNDLGDRLCVTAQQIHKYETGENRISAENIKKCSEIFSVPVGYFYGETSDIEIDSLDVHAIHIANEMTNFSDEVKISFLRFIRKLKPHATK